MPSCSLWRGFTSESAKTALPVWEEQNKTVKLARRGGISAMVFEILTYDQMNEIAAYGGSTSTPALAVARHITATGEYGPRWHQQQPSYGYHLLRGNSLRRLRSCHGARSSADVASQLLRRVSPSGTFRTAAGSRDCRGDTGGLYRQRRGAPSVFEESADLYRSGRRPKRPEDDEPSARQQLSEGSHGDLHHLAGAQRRRRTGRRPVG